MYKTSAPFYIIYKFRLDNVFPPFCSFVKFIVCSNDIYPHKMPFLFGHSYKHLNLNIPDFRKVNPILVNKHRNNLYIVCFFRKFKLFFI